MKKAKLDFISVLEALKNHIDHGIPLFDEMLNEAKLSRACLVYVARRSGYLSAQVFNLDGKSLSMPTPMMAAYARADKLTATLCSATLPAKRKRRTTAGN